MKMNREELIELIDNFNSSSVLILNDTYKIDYQNSGMKKLLADNDIVECFQNPTWSSIINKIKESDDKDIFSGIVTFTSKRSVDGYISLDSRIFRIDNYVVMIFEYDFDDILDASNSIFKLNKEITILQRDLISKKKELEFKNKTLEKNINELNKLLGMAAHDLRNPIGAIHSFVDLLLEDEEEYGITDSTKEILDIIGESSAYMLYIIQNLLDLSKVNAGKLDMNLGKYNLIDLVKDILNRNRFRAKNKNIHLDINIAANIRSYVRVDQTYLKQVIENLVSNSIKYSYENTTVVIDVFNQGEEILFEVKDNGVGIPESEQDKLFKAFSKTSAQPTGDEISTGLGLAISQKVINAHHGKIGYKPNSPNGSIFWFSLETIQ